MDTLGKALLGGLGLQFSHRASVCTGGRISAVHSSALQQIRHPPTESLTCPSYPVSSSNGVVLVLSNQRKQSSPNHLVDEEGYESYQVFGTQSLVGHAVTNTSPWSLASLYIF